MGKPPRMVQLLQITSQNQSFFQPLANHLIWKGQPRFTKELRQCFAFTTAIAQTLSKHWIWTKHFSPYVHSWSRLHSWLRFYKESGNKHLPYLKERSVFCPVVAVRILQNDCTYYVIVVACDLVANTVHKFAELTVQHGKGSSTNWDKIQKHEQRSSTLFLMLGLEIASSILLSAGSW